MEEPINCQDQATGFCCRELPAHNGFTWKLTSIFGKLLHAAKQQFGPRNHNWTILGVEFCNDGAPRVWYPKPARNVVIQLSYAGRLDTAQAQFDLAQEIVHLLAPNSGGPANVFEEGLATTFGHQQSALRTTEPVYLAAEKLVAPLLAANPSIILAVREVRLNFFDFTPDFVREHCSQVSEADAEVLCSSFQRA